LTASSGAGGGALEPDVDGRLQLLARGSAIRIGLLGRQRPFANEARPEARNRVAALGGLVLLGVAEDG
jgi:hypothetical protein